MLRRGAVSLLGVAAIALLTWEVLPSGGPSVSLAISSGAITIGQRIVLSGHTAGVRGSSPVSLYARTYPATVGRLIATGQSAPDGSFSFACRPDRDTSFYVQVADGSEGPSSVPVFVDVDTRTHVETKPLAFGQVVIRISVVHPPDLDWDDAPVNWAFASGRDGRYVSAPVTRTVGVRQDVDLLTTTRTLPPGPFRWEACFYAPGSSELGDPDRPRGCKGQGFSGTGSLPRETGGFPQPAAIASAERYLSGRTGHTALAVVDTKGGVWGVNLNRQFITGSVVKAMLLVAYLRRLNAMGQRTVDPASNALLEPMIEVSDNDDATDVWNIVGDSGLYAVAHAAGMTHFSVPVSASWGSQWGTALITARDQAQFFWEMDSLIPRQFVNYANYLLSHIAAYESWGIPSVARPLGYQVWFKAGWRPSPDIFLVHQIARLEKNGQRFAIAIMTDGDPDEDYGIATIEGATRALLGLS